MASDTGEHQEREKCPIAECVNAQQPPEKWVTCFYAGSPCQTARKDRPT